MAQPGNCQSMDVEAQAMVDERTERAWAALSSGDASGSNRKAVMPAFLDSSAITCSASSGLAALLGSLDASTAPWDLSSPAREERFDSIAEREGTSPAQIRRAGFTSGARHLANAAYSTCQATPAPADCSRKEGRRIQTRSLRKSSLGPEPNFTRKPLTLVGRLVGPGLRGSTCDEVGASGRTCCSVLVHSIAYAHPAVRATPALDWADLASRRSWYRICGLARIRKVGKAWSTFIAEILAVKVHEH